MVNERKELMLHEINRYKVFSILIILILLAGICFVENGITAEAMTDETRQEINNLTFALNSKQFFLDGSSEKLILKDNNGYLWLFKMAFEYYDPYTYFGVPCVQTDSFITSFYKACGLASKITYYPTILSINGQRRYGNLVKLLLNSCTLEEISFDNLTLSQRQFIQKVFILDWLLAIGGVDKGDFIISQDTKEMCTIDKEHAFRDLALPSCKVNDNPLSFLNSPIYGLFYLRFFSDIVNNKKDIDLADIFEFIDSVQSIDDELFCELFTPYLRQALMMRFKKLDWILTRVVHEAQFEYLILKFGSKRHLSHVKFNRLLRKTSDKEVDNYLKLLLHRKKKMREAFENLYKTILHKQGIPVLNRIPAHIKGSRNINAILFSLKKDRMIDFTNLSDRQDIKVASCERAWFLLKQKPPIFKERNRFIKELRNIKETNLNELMAKELYIREVKEQGFCKHRIILTPQEAINALSSSNTKEVGNLN